MYNADFGDKPTVVFSWPAWCSCKLLFNTSQMNGSIMDAGLVTASHGKSEELCAHDLVRRFIHPGINLPLVVGMGAVGDLLLLACALVCECHLQLRKDVLCTALKLLTDAACTQISHYYSGNITIKLAQE